MEGMVEEGRNTGLLEDESEPHDRTDKKDKIPTDPRPDVPSLDDAAGSQKGESPKTDRYIRDAMDPPGHQEEKGCQEDGESGLFLEAHDTQRFEFRPEGLAVDLQIPRRFHYPVETQDEKKRQDGRRDQHGLPPGIEFDHPLQRGRTAEESDSRGSPQGSGKPAAPGDDGHGPGGKEDQGRPFGAILETTDLQYGHGDRDDNRDSHRDGGRQDGQEDPDEGPGDGQAQVTGSKETDDPVGQAFAQSRRVQRKAEKEGGDQDPERPGGVAVENQGGTEACGNEQQYHDRAADAERHPLGGKDPEPYGHQNGHQGRMTLRGQFRRKRPARPDSDSDGREKNDPPDPYVHPFPQYRIDPLVGQHAGSLAARRLHVSSGIVNDRFAAPHLPEKWG